MNTVNSNYGLCLILRALAFGVDNEANNKLIQEYCVNFDSVINDDRCFSSNVEIIHSLNVHPTVNFLNDVSEYLNKTISIANSKNDGEGIAVISKINFKCKWLHRFTSVGLREFNKSNKKIEMMELLDTMVIGDIYGGMGFIVPFENNDYSMILFLPFHDYSSADVKFLDPFLFYNNYTNDKSAKQEVRITIPKIHFEDSKDLTKMLQLNLASLFDSSTETYFKIGNIPLELLKVQQSVDLTVEEIGAQATIETESDLGWRFGEYTYTFDRPFVGHIINNKKNKTILSFEYNGD